MKYLFFDQDRNNGLIEDVGLHIIINMQIRERKVSDNIFRCINKQQ